MHLTIPVISLLNQILVLYNLLYTYTQYAKYFILGILKNNHVTKYYYLISNFKYDVRYNISNTNKIIIKLKLIFGFMYFKLEALF